MAGRSQRAVFPVVIPEAQRFSCSTVPSLCLLTLSLSLSLSLSFFIYLFRVFRYLVLSFFLAAFLHLFIFFFLSLSLSISISAWTCAFMHVCILCIISYMSCRYRHAYACKIYTRIFVLCCLHCTALENKLFPYVRSPGALIAIALWSCRF